MKKITIILLGIAVILGGITILLTCLSPEEADISPTNGEKIAALVVINKTGSQIIDSVNFTMGNKEYTMDTIGVHDRHYTVLEQGNWEIRLNFTQEGKKRTAGPFISVVVPSNDPHVMLMHYLYFYLNKQGNYALSQTWPPFPNDADERDMLPPDAGYGRGLIKIVNNSHAMVEMVTIHNLLSPTDHPLTYSYHRFTPSVPIQDNKTGYVEVTGTPEFPIKAHGEYLIQMTLESKEGIGIIERKVYIKDRILMIVIAGRDFHVVE